MFKKTVLLAFVVLAGFGVFAESTGKDIFFTDKYKEWKNGPPADPNFFLLAVWGQQPVEAVKYKAAGINTYVSLWQGPKAGQIEQLKAAGMYLVCDQNGVGLAKKDDKTIIAWMHGDEPDNAQAIPVKKGEKKQYGPFIKPAVIVNGYKNVKAKDTSRPVLLNLGCGVADDEWKGRGAGAKLSDYKDYSLGADVVSFDVYPVVSKKGNGENNLWWQAKGLDRLKEMAGESKIRWNCIECTHINNAEKKPTSMQVKAEIWISILHGSKGIIYFCHQFAPKFDEKALLNDSGMLSSVTAINSQITSLAPVINSPDLEGVKVTSTKQEIPVEAVYKKYKGVEYIFSVPMRNGETSAKFEVSGLTGERTVEVIGESRKLKSTAQGSFEDSFKPWQVHLYKIGKVD